MSSKRFDGIWRPTVEEVQKLQGPPSMREEYKFAKLVARVFYERLDSMDYVHALGSVTGNQAMQMVKAGLPAIYCSGWQVAADANDSNQMYPDQSLYAVNSVPLLVKKINNCLKRSAQIEWMEDCGGFKYLCPIIADAEAGFGGPLNAFELMKSMIEAGAAGVHFEDQLSSAKKCGHLGGKVLVPASEFIKKLKAARLAAEVMGVETVLIARTDANAARLLTSNIDKEDKPFVHKGDRTTEGFHNITGGIDMAINRGLQYAPYADLLWCETSTPSLKEAKIFAEAIHKVYPGKKLAYNCFHKDTEFITDTGTKSFKDFKHGDFVKVLTHLGNWKLAVVKNYGNQFLQEVSFEKGKKTTTHKVKVTSNHKWILSNKEETTNLKIGDKVLCAPENHHFHFDNLEPFEKLYWCYGYVYGDGTKIKKNGKYISSLVRLCKNDARYKDRFEEMGFKTSTSLSLNGDYIAYTGAYLKTLPDLEKDSISLIKAFVNGLLAADGAKLTNKNGFRYRSIQATGKKTIDFLMKTLPMCGLYITRIEDYTDQITNFGRRSDITYRINLSYNKRKYNKFWSVTDIQLSLKKDEVWCLEVEDDASFVLPMGISTGNCSPSFNWNKNLDSTTIAKFQNELGAMGYKFQFITLAGFHSLNSDMFSLAKEYNKSDMTAYANLQQGEFDMEKDGYTAHKHQREVGVSYFDKVAQTIDSNSATLAESGSTEKDQF